jgi:predicted amidohydrolase
MMTRLTVSLIQTELHWENKQANLAMFDKKLQALPAGTHVAVLPEMFSTGFSMNAAELAENMEGPTVHWMRNKAAEKKMILTGSLIIEENGQYFNRLVWMLPNGQYGCYDKRHLFAYAGEDRSYTGGKERFIASVNGWRIHTIVCYDLRFPVWARQQTGPQNNAEYDLMICVANWPEKRVTAWKTLLQARAIENQSYVIGVNRVGNDGNGIYHSGDSMVVDPGGQVLYQRSGEEDIFTITLEKEELQKWRERFPFWRDADRFEIFT